MKRLFTIFFALLLGITAAFAQTQPTLPYQAVVRDNQNHLLKDADVSIDVQIYEGATLRYSETQTPHSNANGLISFNIGAGSGATGTMADVADWRVAKFKFTYHLTDGDVVVTDSVHAVPYALQTAFATGGNFLTSDSAVITTMQGNITTNTTNIAANTADIAALANRVNTFNTNVCDSVATCVGNAIDARGFLTSDSAVITTMQGNIATNTTDIATNTADIAALANRVNTFNTNVCDSVKNCDFSGNASIQNMLQELSDLISAQNHKIDSLAHIVDSLSNLPHGDTPGGDEPTIVDTVTCYPNLGSNVSEKKTVTRGENFNLSSVTFTHPVETNNWEIASWNTKAAGTGTRYERDTTITTTGNLTLYAQWRTFCTGTPSTNEVGTDNRIDSVKDVDNNKYAVVKIGNQCWMKENLKTTKYADNTEIARGPSTSSSDAYWYYPNNNSSYKPSFGLLYNWPAVMHNSSSSSLNPSGVQGICPNGWHVPSDAEWKQMEMEVGMSETDANTSVYRGRIAAKLCGSLDWISSTNDNAAGNPDARDRNSTGFSALPAGFYDEMCYEFGTSTFFWSATGSAPPGANMRQLNYDNEGVLRNNRIRYYGFSVRCVRN